MQINQTLKEIKDSGTAKTALKTKELIATGKDIIDLTEGQPHHNTPEHIIHAASNAAFSGHTKYTPVAGISLLRNEIAKKINNQCKTNYTGKNIVVGCGGKQLLYNALMVSLEPDNEVIIPAPYWVSYPEMVKLSGGVPIIVSTEIRQDFKITPEQLEKAISKNTRWLIINSPNNPTGSVYTKEELVGIGKVLLRNPQVSVLYDTIYEDIIFDNLDYRYLTQMTPELTSRVLTVSGVSKSYAMTGWRIGYCAGETPFIEAMIKLQGQSTTNPSSVSQFAALEALTGPQNFLTDWCEEYQHSRNLVLELLGPIEGFYLHKPKGAFYLFVGCNKYFGQIANNGMRINNDDDFCNYLLEEALVSCIPGSVFGSQGNFRLCFSKTNQTLVEAAQRIKRAVGELKIIT